MIDLANEALAWIGDLLNAVFTPIVAFFLQLFPDADTGVVSAIRDWGNSMAGFDLSFNVFYFVDIGIVSLFLTGAIAVVVAAVVYRFARVAFETISRLVEMIPFIE